jgi:hypothetical protein
MGFQKLIARWSIPLGKGRGGRGTARQLCSGCNSPLPLCWFYQQQQQQQHTRHGQRGGQAQQQPQQQQQCNTDCSSIKAMGDTAAPVRRLQGHLKHIVPGAAAAGSQGSTNVVGGGSGSWGGSSSQPQHKAIGRAAADAVVSAAAACFRAVRLMTRTQGVVGRVCGSCVVLFVAWGRLIAQLLSCGVSSVTRDLLQHSCGQLFGPAAYGASYLAHVETPLQW